MRITDEFPINAVNGCDYLSLSARGDIVEPGPDGNLINRPEKVLITDHDVDMDHAGGTVCFGERTVRHLGAMFGMVDGWRAQRLRDEYEVTREERDALSARVCDLQRDLTRVMELEKSRPEKVFCAIDGTEFDDIKSARSHSLRLARVAPTAADVRPVALEDAPFPRPEVLA